MMSKMFSIVSNTALMSPRSAGVNKRRALLVVIGLPIFTLLALQLHLLLSQEPIKTISTSDSPLQQSSSIRLTKRSNDVKKPRRNEQVLTLKTPPVKLESHDSPSKIKSSKKLLTKQPSNRDAEKQRDSQEIVSLQTPLTSKPNDSIQPSQTIKSTKKLFTKLPPIQNRTYYMDCGNDCHSVTRAFRIMGWTRVNSLEEAQVTWTYKMYSKYTKQFASWQRYNHLLSKKQWNEFRRGLFQEKRGKLPVGLETYFVPDNATLLKKRLLEQGGMDQDWMLKSASSVSLMPRNPDKLKKAIDREENEMVQAAVCNEMSWNGKWFEMEVYWFVASTNPLTVFYMDGHVWIGDYKDPRKRTIEATWSEASFDDLTKVISKQYKGDSIANPMMHVRNQVKQAIGRVAAEYPKRSSKLPAEDSFELYSAGFVVDKDLNVFLSNLEREVFLGEEYYFRLQLHHEMNYGIVSILQEIWAKQEAGDAIFPVKDSGRWEIVFADGWKYEYKGHERLPQRATC